MEQLPPDHAHGHQDAATGSEVPVGTVPPVRRRLFLALGYAFLGLGAAGAALPLLPTTPFLLLAAWAFTRSSPALRDRLYADPRFGPLIRDWQVHGAIPRRAKAAALAGLLSSWTVLLFLGSGTLVLAGVGCVMALVAAFILTRPAGPPPAGSGSEARP
ncbi:YbaN family protein [Azospirillum sp. SYSU D00513]|uniref:YbaN family protein n=1 Tax=Azospirillum sp. SYSU D00513 TaxID=2812561 RepID=UPI001A96C4C5|nr:YbaN family protein [Azospirillum sp. SYSU D00513]